jgi:hypothetical protein
MQPNTVIDRRIVAGDARNPGGRVRCRSSGLTYLGWVISRLALYAYRCCLVTKL